MHHHEEHGHHHCRHHDDEGEEGGRCGCEQHGGHRHEHGEEGHRCGCEHHGEHHHEHGEGGCDRDRECCCGRGPHHGREHRGPCGGGPGRHFRRHFFTREERLAWLEAYLKELQAEVKAVEEKTAELRAAS